MKENRVRNIIMTMILGTILLFGTRADTHQYSQEVKKVEIDGPGYTANTPGSWHIDKSAKWTGLGKAEVTFDVTSKLKTDGNNIDVVLVMDVSESMEGDKLNRAKEDAHELIDTLLSDSNNKAALITFDTSSVIKSNFTNNKTEMLNLIDNLSTAGSTNYNAGLNNALQVLNGYSELGDEYQKIEYIESDGSSYIDTGITLDSKYTFESVGSIPSGKSGSLIDGYYSNSARQGLLFNNTSSNRFAYYWFGVGNTFVNLADTGIDLSSKFNLVQNKDGITITQGANTILKNYSGTNGTSTATINLLRQVQNSYAGYARIYSAKIKDGNILVADYIPVIRKSDGAIGVYDKVRKTFLTNAGSGAFIKGPDIEEDVQEYQKQSNRDIVLLFMTDGYPNVDTPNQIGTYEKIKDEYPYMQVSGIQYEMGQDVIQEIKEISDVQFAADQTNLSNVLFDASISPYVYEKFEIVDYIEDDYFYVESVNDIKVPYGEVKLLPEGSGQKVIWTLDNLYRTGSSIQMKINLTLKNGISEGIEYYPTNRGEDITSKLPDEEQKKTESDKTPVLKGKYKVIYDKNLPTGCSNSTSIPEEEYQAYEKVTKKTDELTCPNYNFKGWEIDGEDVKDIKRINDEVFIMPDHNVTIRGIWTKQKIDKSMDGTVYENKTLYKYVKEDITNNNKGSLYTGAHNDSLAGSGTEKIYYYTATGSNNVIFANFCWNIIRTTDTGGVKLVYSGLPSSDGKCNNTGTNSQIGTSTYSINSSTYKSPAYVGYMYNPDVVKEWENGAATSGSLYGTNVTYSNGTYTLTNTSTTLDTTHHYTCNNTTGTCSTVRYYYYNNGSDYKYMELNGEANIEELLDNMLWRDDVNKVNSGIKTTIDTWYQNNMTSYTSYLEDAVWCNDRSLSNTGDYTYQNSGWNPNGGLLTNPLGQYNAYLHFKHSYWTQNGDLSCSKDTDKFTMGNTKAKLDYPVGLLTAGEHYLGGSNVFKTGSTYWLASPSYFFSDFAYVRSVRTGGLATCSVVYYALGVRPAVSLSQDTNVTSGDGSVDTPYIIQTE